MPGNFRNCYNYFATRSTSSSTVHNNVQVTNSILQMLTTSVASYAPSIIIPGTVAQTLASIYVIAHSDSYASEKILHLLQGCTSAARFGLAVTLIFEKQQCSDSSQSNTCTASFLLLLIYSAIVSVNLAASALPKEIVRNSTQPDNEHSGLVSNQV
jgi:hypothetical protein